MKQSDLIKAIKELKAGINLLEDYLLDPDKSLENSIFLEARQHGNYSYPDLLVSMHRLGLTNEVEKAANKLGLKVSNTAKEQDGHQYIGGINHEQAISLVKVSGLIPINLRLFVDFLKEIKNGLDGKKEVYDGNKNIIPYDRLLTVWNEITEVRNPYRTEHLDNKFVSERGRLYTMYHKINLDGTLYLTSELLEDCLMKDKLPGINLEDWLERANIQGLPPKNVGLGSLRYWPPRDDAVVRFYANSVYAVLGCNRNPLYSNSGLGVRTARIKE